MILLSKDATFSTFVFLIVYFFLYLAYRPSGWFGTLTSFSTTLIVFALQLSGLWQSGASNSLFIRGGFLPISDAHHYYSGALELLEGGRLSVIASRRPLFSGMLATLLGLTQQNLQVTIALLVLTAYCRFMRYSNNSL